MKLNPAQERCGSEGILELIACKLLRALCAIAYTIFSARVWHCRCATSSPCNTNVLIALFTSGSILPTECNSWSVNGLNTKSASVPFIDGRPIPRRTRKKSAPFNRVMSLRPLCPLDPVDGDGLRQLDPSDHSPLSFLPILAKGVPVKTITSSNRRKKASIRG